MPRTSPPTWWRWISDDATRLKPVLCGPGTARAPTPAAGVLSEREWGRGPSFLPGGRRCLQDAGRWNLLEPEPCRLAQGSLSAYNGTTDSLDSLLHFPKS